MNHNTRPDPDQLLASIQQEQAKAARGKLKIFFGATAGVGKTYAMLIAARRAQELAIEVVIGVIETHGRKETIALLEGLEIIPRRQLSYKNNLLEEFDLDGALARHPRLILIDELAHSNVAGCRHPKRWQDVQELLNVGIDVYTTINVQHLETFNDVISSITGIKVWETVPDHVFDQADEVVLVDLPPDELLQRLQEGKVYLPKQAESAITNFFRKGNLIALRELALRRTADRVDSDMLAYRHQSAVETIWPTKTALLVCISSGIGAERLVRTGARLAEQLAARLHVLHVATNAIKPKSPQLMRVLELAQTLGAQVTTLTADEPAIAIVNYARRNNLAWVLIGRDHTRNWRPWHRSLADRIGHLAADINVIQVARDELVRTPAPVLMPHPAFNWMEYLKAITICTAAVAITIPLAGIIDLTNIAMLLLLAVLIVAVILGQGPAIVAAFFIVGAFDFFFVPPRLSLTVSDAQYFITFSVMLMVALIIGQLTARYKQQAHIAMQRETRSSALYQLARELSAALLPIQIVAACNRFLTAEFAAQAGLLLMNLDGNLDILQQPNGAVIDEGVARWTFDHGEPAGLFTATLPGSSLLYLPLKAPMRTRGVLAIAPNDAVRIQGPEARYQLETFANLIAIAVERIHYVEVAQNTLVQMESESLRNSLLAALSHDLRTPLSVLVGLTESLQLTSLTSQQSELIATLHQESQRLNRLVNNLLDMARLQAGKVQLNRQWQPLEEVVGSSLKTMELSLTNHQVQVILPADLPLLELDAVLMERVLVNLLENAAKYTPPGTNITIGATMREHEIEVFVADCGPGFKSNNTEALFQKFTRGNRESITPGVGLGLAICRAIIEAHGGNIRAENRIGGGACLVFSLPRGMPPGIIAESPELNVNNAV